MHEKDCPFCSLPANRIISDSDYTLTIRDGFPVSDGHTLIIPRRHIETYFDATPWEQQALWQGVDAVAPFALRAPAGPSPTLIPTSD